jgi:hypothetical protein
MDPEHCDNIDISVHPSGSKLFILKFIAEKALPVPRD